MPIRAAFFESTGGDRRYTADRWAQIFAAIVTQGYIPGFNNNLLVTEAIPPAMSVLISTGAGFIQGRYVEIYSTPISLTVAAADATQYRRDLVILRLDLSAGVRDIVATVKQGALAATAGAAVYPTLQRDATIYEVALAGILVNPGDTAIQNADLTDLRANTTYWGRSSFPDLLTHKDATTLDHPDGSVTLAKLAAGSVNNSKMVAGTAVANLGFTPLSNAGGNVSGGVGITASIAGQNALVLRHTLTAGLILGILNEAGTDWRLLFYHGNMQLNVPLITTQPAQFNVSGAGVAPFSTPSAALVTNLNAHYLNGRAESYFATKAALDAETAARQAMVTVPSGMIAAFQTAAAIPSGWSRYTAADGRLLVGAGTAIEHTFTENTAVGSTWTHTHGPGSFVTSTRNTGGQNSGDTWSSAGAAGGVATSPNHTHSVPASGISGSSAGYQWMPVARVVVFAIKN